MVPPLTSSGELPACLPSLLVADFPWKALIIYSTALSGPGSVICHSPSALGALPAASEPVLLPSLFSPRWGGQKAEGQTDCKPANRKAETGLMKKSNQSIQWSYQSTHWTATSTSQGTSSEMQILISYLIPIESETGIRGLTIIPGEDDTCSVAGRWGLWRGDYKVECTDVQAQRNTSSNPDSANGCFRCLTVDCGQVAFVIE